MPKSQFWNKQICLPYVEFKAAYSRKKIQKALRLKTSNELDSVSSSVLYVHSTFFFLSILFYLNLLFLFYMVIIHFCVCLIKWQAGPSG